MVVLSLLALVSGGLKVLGCGGSSEVELAAAFSCECERDSDCTDVLYIPGTVCRDRVCVCRFAELVPCCDGPRGDCDLNCRLPEECFQGGTPHRCAPATVGASASGAGGGGGMGGASASGSATASAAISGAGGQGGAASGVGGAGGTSAVECLAPEECPGPPDHRCGYATCDAGKCGLVISPGPTKSQVRGDCHTVYCDSQGNAEDKVDLGDFYNDGKQCSLDVCDGGTPQNMPYPDGVKCPEAGYGVCFQGDCVECIDSVTTCPEPGDICDGVYCVAMACAQKCGNGCAPCPPTYPCDDPSDCAEGVCMTGMCSIASCDDGVHNDGETGIDCGAPSCANKCPDGQGCAAHTDCTSGVCWGAKCQAPACDDGVMNGDELGIDCGGLCDACP